MALDSRRRATPWPVGLAASLIALSGLVSIVVSIIALIGGLVPAALTGLIVLFVSWSTALGVRQGRRGARVVALLISGAIVATGPRLLDANGPTALLVLIPAVLVIALLALPAQSRAWFRPPGTQS